MAKIILFCLIAFAGVLPFSFADEIEQSLPQKPAVTTLSKKPEEKSPQQMIQAPPRTSSEMIPPETTGAQAKTESADDVETPSTEIKEKQAGEEKKPELIIQLAPAQAVKFKESRGKAMIEASFKIKNIGEVSAAKIQLTASMSATMLGEERHFSFSKLIPYISNGTEYTYEMKAWKEGTPEQLKRMAAEFKQKMSPVSAKLSVRYSDLGGMTAPKEYSAEESFQL